MSGGPLHWFRKNQKIMLVVFGVLLMIVFTVGGVLPDLLGGGGQNGQGETVRQVASTKFGKFTNKQLDDWFKANQNCADFTFRLANLAGATQDNLPKAKAQYIQSLSAEPREQRDREILLRMALAKFAEEKGMYVGDDTIDEYFNKLCNNELGNQGITVDDFNLQLKKYSLAGIRRHLKTELLAIYRPQLLGAGLSTGPTPLEIWEGHKRFQNKVEIEYVSYSVDDFLDKVSETPSKDEIRALYEEGMDRVPNFATGPGFKTPRIATVGYFAAKRQNFLDAEKAKITEAEVQTKYHEWVENEDSRVIESKTPGNGGAFVPNKTGSDDNEDAPTDENPTNEKSKTGENEKTPGLTSPENNKKNPVDPKNDPAKTTDPKGTKPGVKSTANEPKKNETKTPETKTPETKNSENKESPEKALEKQSNINNGGDFQFVSVTQEKTDPKSAPKQTPTDPKKTAKKDSPEKKADPTQDGKKQSEAPKQDPKKEQDPKKQDDKKGEAPDSLPPVDLGNDKKPKTDDKPIIKPLDDKMKDKIREELAKDAADKALKNALENAETDLINYLSEYDEFKNQPDEFPEPDRPNFEAIAGKYGLTFKEYVSIDLKTLSETEFGKTQIKDEAGRFGFNSKPSVAAHVFLIEFVNGSNQAIHATSPNDEGWEYIYWIIDRVHAEKVSRDKAEPQIIQYFKRNKAFEMAISETEKLAEKISSQSKLLSAELGDKVKRSAEFSWLKPNPFWEFTQQNPQFAQQFGSQPAGQLEGFKPAGEDTKLVENISHEFMAKVFSLEENEIGVAADSQKENVYLFQIVKKTKQTEFEKTSVFNELPHRKASIFSQVNQQRPRSEIFQNILAKYEVKWYGEPLNK